MFAARDSSVYKGTRSDCRDFLTSELRPAAHAHSVQGQSTAGERQGSCALEERRPHGCDATTVQKAGKIIHTQRSASSTRLVGRDHRRPQSPNIDPQSGGDRGRSKKKIPEGAGSLTHRSELPSVRGEGQWMSTVNDFYPGIAAHAGW